MKLALDLIRTDGNTQPRAKLDEDAVRDYALDLLDGQTFPPIVVFHDGADYWLSAGFHRLAAAVSIGLTHLETDVREGGPREAYRFAVEDNRKNGVRYINADKRAILNRHLADPEWREWSDRRIARECGVDHKTVAAARLRVTGEFPQLARTYIDKHGNVSTMNVANIGQQSAIAVDDDDDPNYGLQYERGTPAYCKYCYSTHDQWGLQDGDGWVCQRCDHATADQWMQTEDTGEAEWREDRQSLAAHQIEDIAVEAGLEVEIQPTDYNGDEWYTPAEYVEAARDVLGGIDLDPASCAAAQTVVNATDYYTEDRDGLMEPWSGRVWLNPPYSMPLIQKFVKRLIDHYEAGDVTAAIILTNNSSDAGWFHSLAESYPFCLTRGRVPFWRPNQTTFATRQGQAFFYLGNDVDRFVRVFSAFGVVVNQLEVPA